MAERSMQMIIYTNKANLLKEQVSDFARNWGRGKVIKRSAAFLLLSVSLPAQTTTAPGKQ
jgi:hypothetical protein